MVDYDLLNEITDNDQKELLELMSDPEYLHHKHVTDVIPTDFIRTNEPEVWGYY